MREREIFLAASEIKDEQEQLDYVKQACGNDAALQEHIRELLEIDRGEHRILSRSPVGLEENGITDASNEGVGATVGRYKLLEELGEGGFGVVFLAEQERPVRRKVALKIIKPGMDTRKVIARFEAERQALAMMDHPNIAKVFDAGTTGAGSTEQGARSTEEVLLPAPRSPLPASAGRPYFVMELVQGVPFTDYCDQFNLTTRERLELFITVCQAVQHAHQKGVIHRDIKPTNILVSMQDGRPAPKIIDFGVAKALNQRLTEDTLATGHTQMIGTPLYMSPEQAELSPLGADTRSDVYSLGVVLYELLTGTTPFDKDRLYAAGYDEMRRIFREDEPPRPSTRISTLAADALTTVAEHRRADPRRLAQSVRGDLDLIVMKCLEKDRNRRYESAGSLAEDVRRYLAGEPIHARPQSLYYRASRFVSRNRLPVASGLAVSVALVAGTIGTTIGLIRATSEQSRTAAALEDTKREKGRAESALALADQNFLISRRNAYAADMFRAFQILRESNDTGQIRQLLDHYRPEKELDIDLRGWEWRYLWQFLGSDATKIIARYPTQLWAANATRDGRYLLVSHDDGCDVWDLLKGSRRIVSTYDFIGAIHSLGDEHAAVRISDTQVVKLNPGTREELARFDSQGAFIHCFAQSDDGHWLGVIVEGNPTFLFLLWDTNNRQEVRRIPCKLVPGLASGGRVCFSHDGSLVAISEREPHKVRVFEVSALAKNNSPTPQPVHEIIVNNENNETIASICFSPNDQLIAITTVSTDARIHLYDTLNHEIRRLEGHLDCVYDTEFSADGRRLVSVARDNTLRAWELDTRSEPRVLRGHLDEVFSICPIGQGDSYLTAGKDGTILQWDLESITRTIDERAHQTFDGLATPFNNITPPQITADERYIVAPGKDHSVLILDADNLKPSLSIPPTGAAIMDVWHLPDLNTLAISYDTGYVALYTMDGGKIVDKPAHHTPCALWPLPDKRRLASYPLGTDGKVHVKLWSVDDLAFLDEWTILHPQDEGRPPANVMLLTGSKSAFTLYDSAGRISLWDNNTGTFLYNVGFSKQHVHGMAFSPKDENRLACANNFGQLMFFDTKQAKLLKLWEAHRAACFGTVFFPDGERIVTTSSDQKNLIKIWDLHTDRDVATLAGRELAGNHGVAVGPRGNLIVLRGLSGTLNVWRAPSWEEIAASEKLATSSRPLLSVDQSAPSN